MTDDQGVRGILAPVRFDRVLNVVLLVLLAASAIRYLLRHELDAQAVGVLAGAVVLGVAASLRGIVPRRGVWPTVWTIVVVLLWAVLTVIAPSFAWCAVPIAFGVLRIVPFWPAVTVVALMTVVVIVAQLRLADGFDPTMMFGPIGIALATVVSYRALDRESAARQSLLDELSTAQAALAAEQHRAGALAERARLSREIHDSIGQQLSSINLLLQAAERSWDARPDAARAQVETAAATARAGLDEVRRVVRGLAPGELDGTAGSLAVALGKVADEASIPGLEVTFRTHGDAGDVPLPVAAALIRTARGALANVAEHAHATHAVVSLTVQPDELRLDVRDDGVGMDLRPAATAARVRTRRAAGRGRGIEGIAERAAELGGRATVESAPGEGTTVSVSLPRAAGDAPPAARPVEQEGE
ncbi:sensor histidine kinase [Microbacterium sp. NEAU-LLC]|uniref:Oxygen sensor histidine kinase NreB n=1 Tax=Microbacterium helvum TaxID=2773713 RepID=A0ABR8NKN7_9MICO|nr:sensor histidine kinase [Microbacterium helvum]MBD3941238.1 sensor histidine kinase [Microbacterium helvum]